MFFFCRSVIRLIGRGNQGRRIGYGQHILCQPGHIGQQQGSNDGFVQNLEWFHDVLLSDVHILSPLHDAGMKLP